MKTCVAIRHVAFEDLDLFGSVLQEKGFAVRYVDAPLEDVGAVDALAPDLLVVLGGPIGVYDAGMFPFLGQEFALVEKRLKAGRPLIGFCLGAQIMAHVLGGKVYPNPRGKELGWAPLQLTKEGQDSALGGLDDAAVLHWHGDTFDLPQGAVRLASTALTPNQAFSYGGNALALQFHAEVSGRGLERWFVGNVAEINAVPDLGVNRLRADTGIHAPVIEQRGKAVLGRWLDQVCA